MRARDWKLIEFNEDMHVELFNLKDDTRETKNLAAEYPDKAKELTPLAERADVLCQSMLGSFSNRSTR